MKYLILTLALIAGAAQADGDKVLLEYTGKYLNWCGYVSLATGKRFEWTMEQLSGYENAKTCPYFITESDIERRSL